MTSTTDRTDALVERLFASTIGALELFSVYLGAELDAGVPSGSWQSLAADHERASGLAPPGFDSPSPA